MRASMSNRSKGGSIGKGKKRKMKCGGESCAGLEGISGRERERENWVGRKVSR